MNGSETHSFDVGVAQVVGVNAAVIYNHIAFWCRTNRAKGITEMNVDGHWWTTFSVKDASDLYPYMTDRQVSYAIGKLVESGLVEEANHNDSRWCHKKWYRIVDADERHTVEKKPPKPKDAGREDEIARVISYLNERTGKSYKAKTKSHSRLIRARLNDGYTVEQCMRVIDNKCGEWLGTAMSEYLRPSTLFADCHFDEYLNSGSGTAVSRYAEYAC